MNRIYKRVIDCSAFVAALLMTLACSEDEKQPLESSSAVPQQVTISHVERLPGAVKLSYELPNDPTLSYVKAECIMNSELRETKSSVYKNTITIEGFPDTALYEIALYSVTRSEVASQPVMQEVRPLSPAYLEVFGSLNMYADWGGATVSFSNPAEANVVINIMYQDSTGAWVDGATAYTSSPAGLLSKRGMDPKATWFCATVRDRWNHVSDSLKMQLTPIFEEELNKEKFRLLELPTDAGNGYGWVQQNLWDESVAEGKGWVSDTKSPLPIHISVDLGATYNLSRLKYRNREGSDFLYSRQAVLTMELWGSNDPNPDGSWESWNYLMTTKVVKPSGSAGNTLTAEDRELGLDGFEFTFPSGTIPSRYIRFKILETGNNGPEVTFMEFWLWGALVN